MKKEQYQMALNTLLMISSEHLGFRLHYEKNLMQELIDYKFEQESRKDKLIVGSEWECVAENRGRNTVFKKGIEIYIWEIEANFITFGHGTVYGYVRDSVPIDQFLLCFKFLKEGEQE